tara:strand:- start:212 stop:529 length:318 start_codon:yes stop_codon:yes gene_type:complete
MKPFSFKKEELALFKCKSQKTADKLYLEIGCSLADENMWEDGEATRTKVQQKYNLLINVVNELLKDGWKIRGKAITQTDFFSSFSKNELCALHHGHTQLNPDQQQ